MVHERNRCSNDSMKRTPIVLLFFLYVFIFSFLSENVTSIPHRSHEPWSMILCKFKDTKNITPKTRDWYEEWFAGDNPDSIKNYFKWLSNGNYDISGSNVVGWYDLPWTINEVLYISQHDTELQNSDEKSFAFYDKVKQLCIEEAERRGNILFSQKITVINVGSTALYGKKYGVLLTPSLMFSSVLTHEMVHSFFIGHSYSDRNVKIFPFSQPGEYDDRYDLMSTANAYMHKSRFGMSGPGLNGPHLDYLGWLPMDRMLYFGKDGRQNYTIRLSSLSISFEKTHGWLYVMIPYDRDDSNLVYTVELKTPSYFDKGIGQPSVLIHRIQKTGNFYYSVLMSQGIDFYELTEGTEWVTFIGSDSSGKFQWIKISVKKIYNFDADVSITSTFDPRVCKIDEEIAFINIRENEPNNDSSNHVNSLSYCKPKRKNLRQSIDELVKKHQRRKNFFSHLQTFGLNACKEGKVWRSIDDYDYVCVDTRRKDDVRFTQEIANNNNNFDYNDITNNESFINSKNDKRVKKSTQPCRQPLVERKAFLNDNFCVSALEHKRIAQENKNAHRYLKNYAFFNGADTVGP
uniref:Peptidase_M1 domain-containing protein n=1 Tax=Strongyloides papillosus TaxID=174720 RepID=A0A0N5BRL2_STREA